MLFGGATHGLGGHGSGGQGFGGQGFGGHGSGLLLHLEAFGTGGHGSGLGSHSGTTGLHFVGVELNHDLKNDAGSSGASLFPLEDANDFAFELLAFALDSPDCGGSTQQLHEQSDSVVDTQEGGHGFGGHGFGGHGFGGHGFGGQLGFGGHGLGGHGFGGHGFGGQGFSFGFS